MKKNIPILRDSFFQKKPILKKLGAALLIIELFILGPSHVLADFNDGLFASHKGDYLTVFREFRSLAKNGHANAQIQLGIMYEMGLGVKQDYTEASKWYQRQLFKEIKPSGKNSLRCAKKG